MKYKWVVLMTGSVVLAGAFSVLAQEPVVVKFTKVVLADNFDGYEKDKSLPTGGKWSAVTGGSSATLGAYAREDVDGAFDPDKKGKYLQLLDNDESAPLRVTAQDIPGLDSKLVRLSFDFYKPQSGLDDTLSLRMGVGEVSSKPDNGGVGAVVIEGKNRLMPAGAGFFEPGSKRHVDVYYNETAEAVTYLSAEGQESRLRPGLMDIWVDGRLKGAGKTLKRDVPAPTAMKSLRIETFTQPKCEMWLDNLEIAVPQ
jgi:hypothetical protein